MTYADFIALCNDRRSVRYFDTKPLTHEEILQILEAARLAPSVHNLQPWKFHVIENTKLRKEIMDACCYGDFVEGAGAFVVVTCDTAANAPKQDPLWNPHELEYSCMAAMTQALLAATALGFGGCWVSLHHGQAHEALDLPHTEEIVGGLMFGRPRKGEEKPSGEHERASLLSRVTYHE